MKIQTGLKAGNYLDNVQHAISSAGDQVYHFVQTASDQAVSLAKQAGSTWHTLTGR